MSPPSTTRRVRPRYTSPPRERQSAASPHPRGQTSIVSPVALPYSLLVLSAHAKKGASDALSLPPRPPYGPRPCPLLLRAGTVRVRYTIYVHGSAAEPATIKYFFGTCATVLINYKLLL